MSRLGESLTLVALAFAAVSCSSDSSSSGGSDGGDQGQRGEVLAALGEGVVLPAITQFESDATALEAALAEATTDPGGRDAAQAVWIDALETWQQLEVMQFGPLGSSLTVMGGQDLRARLYSWPLGSRCAVDRETVGGSYDDPDALEQIPGVPTGLWAIEYLLFTDDPDNGCTEFDSINSEGTWDSLADMIPQRRLDYAAALGTLVRRRADELAQAWSPEGDNFIEELTNPGRGGAVYGTAQEGLNAVSDAMFYLEKETKDMKLGKPLGLTGCPTQQCPDALESPSALRSKEHTLANLAAFQSLFLGAAPGEDALGFDDLLRDMGADDVADDMASALTAAISATESVPGTFRDALTQNEAELRAAHTAIQAVTDILKTDFLSDLNLELPDRAAGDND